MVTTAKGTTQELYRRLFAVLTGDAELTAMLGGDVNRPRVYQSWVDIDTSEDFKEAYWLTYLASANVIAEVDQTQDVREITLDVHVWGREDAASTPIEHISARVRELLDNHPEALTNETFWCNTIYCIADTKTFDLQPKLWHIVNSFRVLGFAADPSA